MEIAVQDSARSLQKNRSVRSYRAGDSRELDRAETHGLCGCPRREVQSIALERGRRPDL